MVRVFRRPHSATQRSTRAVKKRSQKHKIILESVTQEKKKLRSIISFEAKAPPGYTFIPAGNPKLTSTCKETCRKEGLKVFAVTTTPHMRSHNLSQHVHRIGYHFPSAVVARVCVDLNLYLTSTGKAVPFYDIGSNEKLNNSDSQASQITINTEARDVLRDLFPNIPDSDLNQIIKTAFQKGQRKVGTAVELPLQRRAQLAVVAHIRHVYTDYDRLLKATSFHDARSLVEEATLAKLVEWRGDDENGKTILEDVFREVIVISDDEDDDDADGENDPPRDESVEVVWSNPTHGELQTKPLNYASPTLREPLRELSDDDAPPGFRVVSDDVSRRNKINRRGFSRYQAWDRAINRYREMAGESDPRRPPVWRVDYQRPLLSVGVESREDANGKPESGGSRTTAARRVHAAPFSGFGQRNTGGLNKMPSPNPIVVRRVSVQEASIVVPTEAYSHPQIREASDPILTLNEPYELPVQAEPPRKRNQSIPHLPDAPLKRMRGSQYEEPLLKQSGTSDTPIFVSSLGKIPDSFESQSWRLPGAPITYHDWALSNPQDRALPSIEKPQSPALRLEQPNAEQLNHLTKRMSDGLGIRSVTPGCLPHGDIPYQGGQENSIAPTPKRQRVVQHEPIRRESGLFSRYGAAKPVSLAASQDDHTDRPFIPLEYKPAGRWPIQDGSYTSSKHMAPVDPGRRQPEHFRKLRPDSVLLDPGFGVPSGRRHIERADTYSPQHCQPRLGTHPRELIRCYGSSGESHIIPSDGASRYPAPIPSIDPRAYGGHRARRDLHTNGLNTPGITEPQVSSVQSMVDDRTHVSNEVHRRKHLYAEDFVRPVGLPGSGPLEPVFPRTQTSPREVYAQTRSELPDSRVLAPPAERLTFGSRVVYSSHDNWVDVPHDTVYDGCRLGTRRYERQHPSKTRETHDRMPRAAEQEEPGHMKVVKRQPQYSAHRDRAVVVLD